MAGCHHYYVFSRFRQGIGKIKGAVMRVLISDNLAPVGVEILREAGIEVDVKT